MSMSRAVKIDGEQRRLTIAVVGAIMYCWTLWRTPSVRAHDEEDSEHAKGLRQRHRGTIASVAIALLFGLINFGVDFFSDINAATSTAMIGMTLGGTLGFVIAAVCVLCVFPTSDRRSSARVCT